MGPERLDRARTVESIAAVMASNKSLPVGAGPVRHALARLPEVTKAPQLYVKVRRSGWGDWGLSFVGHLDRSYSVVGCYLTCRKGIQPTAEVYEDVGRSLEELRIELGDNLEHWERAGRRRIGFTRSTQLSFVAEGAAAGEFVDAVAWMRERLDRLVSTLHPRLQRMISARN